MSNPLMIITGRCAVWRLPHTAACARFSCEQVSKTLKALISESPSSLDDCLNIVSELATNAWVHALGGKELHGHDVPAVGSELAIYRRGPQHNAQLVITIFDPDTDLDAIPDPAANVLDELPDKPLNETLPPEVLDALLRRLPDRALEEPLIDIADLPPQHWSGKRGLDVVRKRSHGRCGFRRTRSRLGEQPISGKAAWFTVAIPAGTLAAPPPKVTANPAEAAQLLKSQLDTRGLQHLICENLDDYSMLSLPDLNVWCHNQHFTWKNGEQTVRYPFYDVVETVEQIISLQENHAYARHRLHQIK